MNLIIGSSRSGKKNAWLNLIKHQRSGIDEIYLYVKDSFELKYQLFINGREKEGIKRTKHSKTFLDYSQMNDDVKMIDWWLIVKIYKTIIQKRKEGVNSVWSYDSRHGN